MKASDVAVFVTKVLVKNHRIPYKDLENNDYSKKEFPSWLEIMEEKLDSLNPELPRSVKSRGKRIFFKVREKSLKFILLGPEGGQV